MAVASCSPASACTWRAARRSPQDADEPYRAYRRCRDRHVPEWDWGFDRGRRRGDAGGYHHSRPVAQPGQARACRTAPPGRDRRAWRARRPARFFCFRPRLQNENRVRNRASSGIAALNVKKNSGRQLSSWPSRRNPLNAFAARYSRKCRKALSGIFTDVVVCQVPGYAASTVSWDTVGPWRRSGAAEPGREMRHLAPAGVDTCVSNNPVAAAFGSQ